MQLTAVTWSVIQGFQSRFISLEIKLEAAAGGELH